MEEIYWIWLTRIKKLRPSFLYKLLTKYKSPKNLWYKTKQQLIKDGMEESIVNEVVQEEYRRDLDIYFEYMKKEQIEIVSIENPKYPQRLKQIYDPPIALYIKGDSKVLNHISVAIVGSRMCSDYGKYVAKKIAYQLSEYKINIVSGLAKGIDTAAHTGAIKAHNNTIAVIGSGLDIVYPYENKRLHEQIINEGGAIISEYIVGTKPLAENFPARNRIVSGLSDGVVVVEANKKSGALITVDYALEQGKEIYVVPGNITSKNSVGTNELIKQGAKLITSTNDILEDFFIL